MRLITQKQLQITGDNGTYVMNFHYLEKRRKDVFRKCLERAGANPTFKIIECEREPGYLNQSYPSTEKETYNLISDKEVSLEEIEEMLQ